MQHPGPFCFQRLACLCALAYLGSLVVSTGLLQAADAHEHELRRAAAASITASDLKRHVAALADDTFEGREAGSRGGRAAGVYIVKELQRLGAIPAGQDGSFYQNFGSGYRNILSIVPGSDPELKDEVILIGAHYDHVGYGTPQNSYGPTGYIHNGADDNSSGSSALIALVKAFAQHGVRPRRSLLFVWWDGEEKGLLGSIHWAKNPTVPIQDVKLAINLDMIGRLRKNTLTVYGTRTTQGLRQLVSRNNRETGLLLDFTWDMEDNSDHHTFYTRSIPILMPFTGFHDDYHRPSDDVERVNHEGMQAIVRLLFGTIDDLANAPAPPAFRAAARRESSAAEQRLERPLPPLPGRLGVYWEPRGMAVGGLTIKRVAPGSAAERAGLRAGDVLLSLDGRAIADADEFKRWVLAAPPRIELTVMRAGGLDPLVIPVELAGNPVRLGLAWRSDDAEPGAVLVTRVVPGSPVDEAGIALGDRIYEVNGQPFADSQEFYEMATTLPGPLEMLVETRGRLRTVVVELLPTADTGETETAGAASGSTGTDGTKLDEPGDGAS